MWIVFNAIWLYNMTDRTGYFAVLRRSFERVSDDERIQAIIIAFSFGALLEALAGFGTPVAITASMLVGLGFKPMKAATVALVSNTAPVAFGAIAIPIITLAGITDLPKDDLGAMVGRQTPFLALIVPLILVGMVDGMRGVRQCWPAAMVGGFAFAIGQYACSNFLSVELTDIVAALLSVGALVAFLRVWQPSEPLRAEPRFARPAMAGGRRRRHLRGRGPAPRGRGEGHRDSRKDVLTRVRAVRDRHRDLRDRPVGAVKTGLADTPDVPVARPRHPQRQGRGAQRVTYTSTSSRPRAACCSSPVSSACSSCASAPARAIRIYGETLDQLKWATLTVMAVLGLAYVMNLSGQTTTIGQWIAGAGSVLPFLSPIIGWLGVAVTGSDTSSNSLFGVLQVTAAKDAGFDPTLLAAANSSGGVLGKMISPQNLAIGAAAVGLAGQEV